MNCNEAKHEASPYLECKVTLYRREWGEGCLHGSVVFIFHSSELSFLYLICAAQQMTACLFVLGLKEAELILMGSEHLFHKVTPTGQAWADPETHTVRLLTGNTGRFLTCFQVHCHPMSGRILITISETELPGSSSFSFLLIQEVGCKSFFSGIDDCNLSFWGFYHGWGSQQLGPRSPPDASESADCFWAGHASAPSR